MPMPPDKLGFVANTIDRAANRRSDPQWIESLKRADGSRLVCLSGDRVRIAEGHAAHSSPMESEDPIFLGLDATGRAWFAKEDSFDGGHDLRSVAVSGLVPPEEMGFLAQARALLAWHGRRAFCSNCGARLVVRDAGYRRHCEACKSDHFPRTDPVVIMVAIRDGRCLLGRQSSWPSGMYSALAGFMEPGETIEDAARREVFEESGIRIGTVHYVASQPWPFPSSLMIGLIGEAEIDEITLDRLELEDARWFPAAELRAMLDGSHPGNLRCPPPMAIANLLIRDAIERCA
jgi:NAD+ diphosphatase